MHQQLLGPGLREEAFRGIQCHSLSSLIGRPENCFAGGGMAWAPGEGGGGVFQKWASVPGPLFGVRMDVATKGAGTQILARKIFFHEKLSLRCPTYTYISHGAGPPSAACRWVLAALVTSPDCRPVLP